MSPLTSNARSELPELSTGGASIPPIALVEVDTTVAVDWAAAAVPLALTLPVTLEATGAAAATGVLVGASTYTVLVTREHWLSVEAELGAATASTAAALVGAAVAVAATVETTVVDEVIVAIAETPETDDKLWVAATVTLAVTVVGAAAEV